MNEEQLFKEFEKAFNEFNQPDFLLYEISNANENAHSNFLERLLNYDKKFLQSFLVEVLGFPEGTELKNPRVTTQEKAIGLKQHGFIDVYIENGNQKIIIENKIKGAGDTPKQLARYVATAYGVKGNNAFDEWYKKYEENGTQNTNEDYSNIYMYYLSRLGDKEPSPDSLPEKLKDALGDDNYKKLSYKDNILPWLKDTVMPQIPYQNNGLMICALLQYIAYLEYYTTTQDWQTDWARRNTELQSWKDSDLKKYNTLTEIVNKGASKNDNAGGVDECTAAYISTLELVMEEIFAHDLDGVDGYEDWRIHYTPSFIVLYKQSWTELEERKYACPTIQISIHTPFHAKGFNGKVDVSFFITHISALCVGEKGKKSNGKFPDRLVQALIGTKNLSWEKNEDWDDHNRHYRISHKELPIDVSGYKVEDKEDRVRFYRDVITKLKDKIKIVDDVLAQMKAEKENMSN